MRCEACRTMLVHIAGPKREQRADAARQREQRRGVTSRSVSASGEPSPPPPPPPVTPHNGIPQSDKIQDAPLSAPLHVCLTVSRAGTARTYISRPCMGTLTAHARRHKHRRRAATHGQLERDRASIILWTLGERWNMWRSLSCRSPLSRL